MEEVIPVKFGTINQCDYGTSFWVEPPWPILDAIFGKGPENLNEMIEWNMTTFPRADWNIDTQNPNRFYFKNRADRTVFMLKWC